MRTKTQGKHNEARISVRLVLLSIFCGLFCLAIASAQSSGNATIKKFKAPLEYFDPPHELQVKSYLEGAEAEPQGDGLILLRDAKLQTYQENGAPDMTITTPQCFFNMKDQTVNSAGPFQMRMSNDALLQEGVGFYWEKTNSEFIISNRVQTTVKGRMTNSFAP
jgi:hypothetical protein